MAASGTKGRWARVVRYAFGGFLLLLAIADVWVGFPWYGTLGIVCAALAIIIPQRRIFRPGLNRTGSEIICRYTPWFEGNAYMAGTVIPLMGVAMAAAGRDPGYPAWFQIGGILLMGVMPLVLFSALRMWRRCPLRISPSALALRPATPGSKWTEIRREQVESITPKIVPNPVNGQSLQTEIAYRTGGSERTDIQTVLLGLHLTVQPINLANALVAWKDATDDDPDALLDRIDQILRGHSDVGA
ncbi:hypothetical protein [Mycolicibacter sinensis]|uniref:Uncharacterized protein n=1 Tax=Mycolicibacter sinensis (strain JDM601) TaxID=875328 RepID=A0A1A2NVK6_MYCSD|nr:hypothetical protein [Mycolicibacter sinensis]OBH19104.1 hypothetical protein A5694_19555 [Mycolicibacter sinensis]OBI25207.1 hypothetical protein A5710_09755 [Mycolicibacter sinensis]